MSEMDGLDARTKMDMDATIKVTECQSDLLKKETGKNTQEHIHSHLIEKAKTMPLRQKNQ